MAGLAEPGHAVGCRLEAAAGSSIVRFGGIPIPKAGLFAAGIHQRPGTDTRSVPKTNGSLRLATIVESVVQHAPSTHRRHITQGEGVTCSGAIVAAVVV